jgi:hypothetical protein
MRNVERSRPQEGRNVAEALPRDLALWCQSRMEDGGMVPPHSVLAPGKALGLLPAQVECIVAKGKVFRNRTNTTRRCDEPNSVRLFDLSCYAT